MGRLSRRRFLQGLGAAGLVGLGRRLEEGAGAAPIPAAAQPPFPHGVASGDPLPDRVILWTRLTPPSGATEPVEVRWEIARDPDMREVVGQGTTTASADRDWTVKVDAAGLEPSSTYHYAFSALGSRSAFGRTRTAAEGSPDAVRLAVVTCGDYSRGLFHAYARVAERDDLDAVVHLGDYIYETDRDRVRKHQPPVELRSLADYRGRYASYRLDPNLAEVHRRHPMIWVWDDHETVDGTWMHGADPSNHDPAEDGDFETRKLVARQAALEWLPIRSPDPADPERIYRRFAFGDLVDLVMLDTRRIGRDRQGEGNVQGEFFRQTGTFADPSRHILGAEQERWLIDSLQGSSAAWKLLGNQVVFSQIKVVGAPEATGQSVFANPDQWDGYQPARDRIFDAIQTGGVKDLVVLTGDVHASLAFEVTRDPNNPAVYDPVTSRGTVAVEFVAPSISSAGDPADLKPDDPESALERLILEGDQALRAPNPHLKYIRSQLNGYLLVEASRERLRAEFWLVPRVAEPTGEQFLDRGFTVTRGQARLAEASGQPTDTSDPAGSQPPIESDGSDGSPEGVSAPEDRDRGPDRGDRRRPKGDAGRGRGAAGTSDPAGFTESRRDASPFTG